MTRTAEQAALACAALWVVHTVEVAAYGKRNLSGPPSEAGEPMPADATETGFMYHFACMLTERLHERAERLGLDPFEVEAGRQYVDLRTWPQIQADFAIALGAVGGRLGPR